MQMGELMFAFMLGHILIMGSQEEAALIQEQAIVHTLSVQHAGPAGKVSMTLEAMETDMQ